METHPVAFNWKQSPAHIWFLTTFLKPRQPDDFFQGVDWQKALGEQPSQAIYRFLKLVILTPAPLPVCMEAQFSRDDLRQMCRERELSPGGKKQTLINRLVDADWREMEAATTVEMFQCSDYAGGGRKNIWPTRKASSAWPHQTKKEDAKLSPPEMRKILRWLLLEGVVLGVAGNAVYDLLKKLGGAAIASFEEKQALSADCRPPPWPQA